MSNYKNFVQVGRVCSINFGDQEGKLCTIIDIVDQSTALVDGPADLTGVARQQINLKRLNLTQFRLPIGRGVRPGTLKKAAQKFDLVNKYNNTAQAKKLARQQKRLALTDFERFQVMVTKKAKNHQIRREAAKIKRAGKK